MECRDEAITAIFGEKNIPVSRLLNELDVKTFLLNALRDLTGTIDETFQSWMDVYLYVVQTCTRREAWPRFAHLYCIHSDNPLLKESVNLIPRTTRKRNEKNYREYNLVALLFLIQCLFRFEIPSPLEPILTMYE